MGGLYWDEQLETLPAERRRLLQDHRLRWQVRRCWDGSPFYRARLEAAGLDPATFGGLAEVARLPLLHAEEVPNGGGRERPDESWTVAPQDWWRGVSFEGPDLARTRTDGDIVHQTDLAARALWAAGGRPGRGVTVDGVGDGDEVAELVIAASARIGMTVSQVSDGASPAAGERAQVTIHRPDHASSSLVWRFVWPPVPERAGAAASALILWYVAPTVAYTCQEAGSIHWNDDHFLVEIVDPATSQPLERGDSGAVVVTDLTREGSPLIRFRTRLESALVDGPCACGRTSARSPFVRPLT